LIERACGLGIGEPYLTTPDEFRARIRGDNEKYGKVIRAIGATPGVGTLPEAAAAPYASALESPHPERENALQQVVVRNAVVLGGGGEFLALGAISGFGFASMKYGMPFSDRRKSMRA